MRTCGLSDQNEMRMLPRGCVRRLRSLRTLLQSCGEILRTLTNATGSSVALELSRRANWLAKRPGASPGAMVRKRSPRR